MNVNDLKKLKAELVHVEVEPEWLPILAADEAGKGEPALSVYVNSVPDKERSDILDKIPPEILRKSLRGNQEAYQRDLDKHNEKKRVTYSEAVFADPGWKGMSLRNANYLLRHSGIQLDPEKMPALKQLLRESDGKVEIVYDPSFAALLFEYARPADFDTPIAELSSSLAGDRWKEEQGNASA